MKTLRDYVCRTLVAECANSEELLDLENKIHDYIKEGGTNLGILLLYKSPIGQAMLDISYLVGPVAVSVGSRARNGKAQVVLKPYAEKNLSKKSIMSSANYKSNFPNLNHQKTNRFPCSKKP